MPWSKLDDRFWIHPRIVQAGNTAAGIHARLISYCGCFLTDGKVSRDAAHMIVGGDWEAFNALLGLGLVRELHDDRYEIDYLDYNRDAAYWEAKRESDRKRQAKARGGATVTPIKAAS